VEFEEVNNVRTASNSFQFGNGWKGLERFRRDLREFSPFWRPILSNFPIFGKNRGATFSGKIRGFLSAYPIL
jgi:hypothetical protein